MYKTIFIIIAVLIVAVSAHAEKITVSVMDLKVTSGVSASEAQQLTSKLLNELVICDAFAVVDRDKRDEILREQGFQMTGACDQNSCLVQAGQLLGVQKMIGGCVGKMGRVYSVELQLVDVRTGTIDLAFSREYQGEVSQLLAAMREAAQELSNWGMRPKVVVTPEEVEYGTVRIKTKPKGAVIALDGQYLGMTPAKLSKVEAGEHRLTLSKSGFKRYSTVATVETDKTVTIEAVLDPEQGTSAQTEQEPTRRVEPAASVASSASSNNSDSLVPTGLVAYYPFIGNANDESGHGHHGTVHGAVLTTDRFGNLNSAYSFDGKASYIRVPYSAAFNPTNQITVSAWVKADSWGSLQYSNYIIQVEHGGSPNPGWTMRGGNTMVEFTIQGGGSGYEAETLVGVVPPGPWHHLVGVYDGTAVRIYDNGRHWGSVSYSGTIDPSSSDMFIGTSYNLFRFFDGMIDDVRIYNRALTGNEVSRLYREGGWGK